MAHALAIRLAALATLSTLSVPMKSVRQVEPTCVWRPSSCWRTNVSLRWRFWLQWSHRGPRFQYFCGTSDTPIRRMIVSPSMWLSAPMNAHPFKRGVLPNTVSVMRETSSWYTTSSP